MKPLNQKWVEYYKKQDRFVSSTHKEYNTWVCAWRLMRDFQNTEVVNQEE